MCGVIIFDGLLILGGLWLSDVVGSMWPLYIAVLIVVAPFVVWLFLVAMTAKEERDSRRMLRTSLRQHEERNPSAPMHMSTPYDSSSTYVAACDNCGRNNLVEEGVAARCVHCGQDLNEEDLDEEDLDDDYCYTYIKQGDGHCADCGVHYRDHVRGRPRDH
jgi:hypothetical protein